MTAKVSLQLRIPGPLHATYRERARAEEKSLNQALVDGLERGVQGRSSTAERRPPKPDAGGSSPPAPANLESSGFARDFLDGLKAVHQGFRAPPNFGRWENEARLLLERDQRPLAEAQELARWLFESSSSEAEFWRGNVLSVPKFRQKYDQLRAQKRRSECRGHRPGPIEQMIREYGNGEGS